MEMIIKIIYVYRVFSLCDNYWPSLSAQIRRVLCGQSVVWAKIR